MERKSKYKILENEKIAKDIFKMVLEGNTEYITKPGQLDRKSVV